MQGKPNTDTRVGRMLEGLLATENTRGKLSLTVSLYAAGSDKRKYHQTFRAKAWNDKATKDRMLTLDLNDGDWGAGVYPTKVLVVNTRTGKAYAAKGMQDKLMLYAANVAVQYAFTGTVPQPGNGRVEVAEESYCGRCGIKLEHPDSIALGIGPECAGKATTGTTLTGKARKEAAAQARAKGNDDGAATAAPAPTSREQERAAERAMYADNTARRKAREAAAAANPSTDPTMVDNVHKPQPPQPQATWQELQAAVGQLAAGYNHHPRTMDSLADLTRAEAEISMAQAKVDGLLANGAPAMPCPYCLDGSANGCGACSGTGYLERLSQRTTGTARDLASMLERTITQHVAMARAAWGGEHTMDLLDTERAEYSKLARDVALGAAA